MKPNFLKKIHLIPGDIEQDGLGISDEDTQYLIDHVNIVIHGAATLAMDDPIGKAYKMNIHATKYILDLFERMPNKKVNTDLLLLTYNSISLIIKYTEISNKIWVVGYLWH